MLLGFTLAVLTGLTWTAIGVVISRCAKNSFDVISYSLAQTLLTAFLAFLVYADLENVNVGHLEILGIVVCSAGLVNAVAQKVVKVAMSRGNHGPVWAISQSALIIPFLAGIFLWDSHGTLGQWLGTGLILCGIIIPVVKKFGDIRQWLLPTIIAFFMFGIVQTLYLAPSQIRGFCDTTGLRPTFAALGGFFGWVMVRQYRHQKLSYNKHTIYLAVLMSFLSLISLKIFFIGLDKLSLVGLGNIGIPLIVGSNIVGFSLYSLLILRERLNLIEVVGQAAVMIGIISLAL